LQYLPSSRRRKATEDRAGSWVSADELALPLLHIAGRADLRRAVPASPPDRRPGFAASGWDISASMEDRDELASRLVRAELYKAATRSSFFWICDVFMLQIDSVLNLSSLISA
jgi:hypothetical protein